MAKSREERVIDRLSERAGSKAELARRLGVMPQDINNWRTRGIPLAKCAQVSREFDIPLDELRPEFAPPKQQSVGTAGALAGN